MSPEEKVTLEDALSVATNEIEQLTAHLRNEKKKVESLRRELNLSVEQTASFRNAAHAAERELLIERARRENAEDSAALLRGESTPSELYVYAMSLLGETDRAKVYGYEDRMNEDRA